MYAHNTNTEIRYFTMHNKPSVLWHLALKQILQSCVELIERNSKE